MPIERDSFMRKVTMTSKHTFGGLRFFILQDGIFVSTRAQQAAKRGLSFL